MVNVGKLCQNVYNNIYIYTIYNTWHQFFKKHESLRYSLVKEKTMKNKTMQKKTVQDLQQCIEEFNIRSDVFFVFRFGGDIVDFLVLRFTSLELGKGEFGLHFTPNPWLENSMIM